MLLCVGPPFFLLHVYILPEEINQKNHVLHLHWNWLVILQTLFFYSVLGCWPLTVKFQSSSLKAKLAIVKKGTAILRRDVFAIISGWPYYNISSCPYAAGVQSFISQQHLIGLCKELCAYNSSIRCETSVSEIGNCNLLCKKSCFHIT